MTLLHNLKKKISLFYRIKKIKKAQLNYEVNPNQLIDRNLK